MDKYNVDPKKKLEEQNIQKKLMILLKIKIVFYLKLELVSEKLMLLLKQ